MWTLFKIINFIWLLSSSYAWFTTSISLMQLLVVVNVIMMICLSFLDIEIKFNKSIGRIFIAILGLVIWSTWSEGFLMGIYTFLAYLPVVMLIVLPTENKIDLLQFVTKWYALMLALGLLAYFATLFVHIPSFGRFVYPSYEPFDNYIFFIKTTWENDVFTRFNAFFLEPGHQALASTFLIMANAFEFKRNPYCIILLIGLIFSFSLAGYLLFFTGGILFWIKDIRKAILGVALLAGVVVFAINWNFGNNIVNELIISRLEYDEEKGIKGNNRYFNDTDFIFERAQKTGDSLIGVRDKVNMELVGGAGFKIYVIKNGWIGVILVLLLYLSVIPKDFSPRYTAIFLIVLSLCFIQRSYPTWYSWLLPYVLGIYIHKKNDFDDSNSYLIDRDEGVSYN